MKAINFSAEMVRALLDGRKTQTRRVVNDQLRHDAIKDTYKYRDSYWYPLNEIKPLMVKNNKCHYGKVGDLLYVREPFGKRVLQSGGGYGEFNVFKADVPDAIYCKAACGKETPVNWNDPELMPKRLSRITLKITGIRVERLQDISEADAKAEGAHSIDFGYGPCFAMGFNQVWSGLYPDGPKSWDANPWVWVIEFEVMETRQ